MSRGSQMFWFLNEPKMPTPLQIQHRYTAIDITDEFKKERREYLKWKKKSKENLKRSTKS